jgi:hypothetical protein
MRKSKTIARIIIISDIKFDLNHYINNNFNLKLNFLFIKVQ